MILYHGSNIEIAVIDLKRGRKGKDFGQGFYLTADLSQAKRMAQLVTEREGKGSPIVTSFLFDEKVLSDRSLKVLIFKGYTTEWAKFIVANRQNRTNVQIHDCDIVYGPIANDRVGVQVQRYIQNFIGVRQLIKELKFVKPTFQFFFGTERAIQLLKKTDVI